MSINFTVDKWDVMKNESAWLWPMHWEEVALDKDKMTLDLDFECYELLDKANSLFLASAKDGEKTVGYYWAVIRNHLHYKNIKTAYTDVYFLHPDYRIGMNGVNLFNFIESELKKIGVKKIYTATKKQNDKGSIFEFLGWREDERVYTKYIGD